MAGMPTLGGVAPVAYKDTQLSGGVDDARTREVSARRIRTFHGDAQTFQQGGKPDLVPLKKPKHGSPETLQQKLQPQAQQPAPAVSRSDMIPVGGRIQIHPHAKDDVISQSKPKKKARLPESAFTLSPLKTYSSDFADEMQKAGASTVTVLAAEQDSARSGKRQVAQKKVIPTVDTTWWYVLAGAILLAAGVGGVYLAYSFFVGGEAPTIGIPVAESSVVAPIFADDYSEIVGSGPSLMQAFRKEVSRPIADDTVLLLTLEGAPLKSIFVEMNPRAPSALLRNLNATGAAAGVVRVGGTQSPFFILPVKSYNVTFSAMLSWESTMQKNLALLYPLYPSETAPNAITSIFSEYVDELAGNRDVRVYRDPDGRSILVYGYWDAKTLVIARDPIAFAEIVDRLATNRAAQ